MRVVGSHTCTQHRNNLALIVSRHLPRQNIEHRLGVFPERRQGRQAHDYKACILKRRDVLGSDNIALRLVHRLSPSFHFDVCHTSTYRAALHEKVGKRAKMGGSAEATIRSIRWNRICR